MIDNVRDDVARKASAAREEFDALTSLLKMAVVGAVIGALYTELRKPRGERTWNGKLLGFIPYDFRMPSIESVRTAYWNPKSPKIFSPRPLGVGWAVNIPTLLRRLGVHQGFTKGR